MTDEYREPSLEEELYYTSVFELCYGQLTPSPVFLVTDEYNNGDAFLQSKFQIAFCKELAVIIGKWVLTHKGKTVTSVEVYEVTPQGRKWTHHIGPHPHEVFDR